MKHSILRVAPVAPTTPLKPPRIAVVPSQPPLTGRRLLVVQKHPREVLTLASTLVRGGAEVTVCRTLKEACVHLDRKERGFDGAVVDGESDPGELDAFIARLRASDRPCFTVGIGRRGCPGHARTLVAAGVLELIVPPMADDVIVEAVARCTGATLHLRRRLTAARNPGLELAPLPERKSPKWRGQTATEVAKGHDVDARVGLFSMEQGLSPRERTVLHYIALGYRYQDIGVELSISARTVKMHAANLRRKAGVSDRYELLRKMFAA